MNNMELETTENPWKNKSRVKFIAFADVMVAFIAIIYSTFYMFHYYFREEREKILYTNHLTFPLLIFLWTANLLFYAWQIAVAVVLYASVNLEALETDPYIAIQKCNCWLRTSRFIMGIVVLKLCCIPFILYVDLTFLYDYTIIVGIIEIVFRFLAVWGVRSFVQDLQT